jgi:hypothetical protein
MVAATSQAFCAAANNERAVCRQNLVFVVGSTVIGSAAALERGRRGAVVLIVGKSRRGASVAVSAAAATSANCLAGIFPV